jgi:catechol 2,3-dioxygenase-like lactoylglutathione lyase family enzyme
MLVESCAIGAGSYRPGMPIRGRSSDQFWGVVLEAPDARALAQFYVDLLGWTIEKDETDWVTVAPPSGVAYLAFQTDESYVRPVWPTSGDQPRMMMHLDVEVAQLEVAAADAVAAGATLSNHQPQDDVRVLLDPAGHPFCLYVGQ